MNGPSGGPGWRSLLPSSADLAPMRRSWRRDLQAGLTVAVVALPLALGFGIASGLGAEAGLVTAIVAGALAAVFGGSNLQVSGPTGAMTVVLVPIAHEHGHAGVLFVGLLAGLLLVALAFARAGRYMSLVPAPVVEGFTVGIALVIALQQVPAALGVEVPGADSAAVTAARAVQEFAAEPGLVAPALAALVAAGILLATRRRPTLPLSLLAVILATVAAGVLELDTARVGTIPRSLPAPSLGFVDPGALDALLAPAIAVAALAALESLLSASVADGMTVHQRHDPDRELFGQGLANLAAPLFGGVPATGAIARTAVNVRAGATTRLAALSHALVLAILVLAAAPIVGRIPLAALAGVLIATAWHMVSVGSVRVIARSTRPDALVLVLTAAVTVALDLVRAVLLGLLVTGALALRTIVRASEFAQVPLAEDLPADCAEEEHALLAEHIVAYRLDGPLFFAGAHRFLLELANSADVAVVILRLSRVPTIDASGALVLADAIAALERRGAIVFLSGLRPVHHRPLTAVGVLPRLQDAGQVKASTPEAIDAARARLRAAGVLAEQP